VVQLEIKNNNNSLIKNGFNKTINQNEVALEYTYKNRKLWYFVKKFKIIEPLSVPAAAPIRKTDNGEIKK
jgi:hypothetical protein